MTWKVWTPVGDAHVSRARAALEPCLEEVAHAWFADGEGLRLHGIRAASTLRSESPASTAFLFGEGLALTATRGALRALAESALQYRGGVADSSGSEARALEALALRHLYSLAAAVAVRLGAGPSVSLNPVPSATGSVDIGPHVAATLAFTSRDLRFSLAIGARLLTVRRHGKSRRTLAPLGSRGAVLHDSAVRAVADIGRVRLRIADVAALAEGDVLLLDRLVSEAIDISLGRPPCATLAAYPCAVGHKVAIQFAGHGAQRPGYGR